MELSLVDTLSLQTKEIKTTKIRILLLYIVYPMAIATYFKKALEHRHDVDLIVTGPYTNNWIPWMGGMNVEQKYAIPPHIPLPFAPNIGEVNYDIVKSQLPEGWIPDIILNIDAGIHWKYKPTDGMIVTVGTDPHVDTTYPDALRYDVPRKYSDKFFNMQQVYSKEGDIYLPYAYSKYDHYPQDFILERKYKGTGSYIDGSVGEFKATPIEKDTDAVLIGMPYENRVQWVNELRKRGVSVIFENGPIFDEARALYNRGSVGLNWSSMLDTNARAFEIPAMKLAPVMNITPDMGQFLSDGLDYLGFDTIDEALESVFFLKDHKEDCHRIAESAYNAIQGQTYDARVQQILEECGFYV